MREMCRKLKPTLFEDIVAGVALYRPGPMEAGMLDDFIDRKHGRQKISYPHPLLEPVLSPTYGTFVYQEQVMQAAQVLARFSLGGADLLRRAMGKKKKEEMDKVKAKFVDGCAANGIAQQQASDIFDTIEKFAGYGFNKSHSAAYALVTYQTAYLKCFYPIEFFAALLTTEVSSTENIVKYIHEAKIHGVEVLPPDINISERSFSVDYQVDDALRARRKHRATTYGKIRFGLSAVKGLGDAALDAIVAARGEGPFTSLFDFTRRLAGKVNRKILEVLIKSGAMDGFGRPRAQLFGTIDEALDVADRERKEKESGQTNLFAMFAATTPAVTQKETYSDAGDWAQSEKLAYEKEAVGFYLSGHPLDRYVADAKKLGATPTVELVRQRHNSEAQIVGIVTGLKERKLKTGDGRWAVVTIEDTFGTAEALCFSKVYEVAEPLLRAGQPLLLKGRALIDDVDDDGQQLTPKMRVEAVESLAEAQMKRTRWLDVRVEVPRPASSAPAALGTPFDPRRDDHRAADDADVDAVVLSLEKLKEACAKHPGVVPARVHLDMPAGYSVVVQSGETCKVTPSEELVAALERVKGVLSVVRT
jgi:DNA polymerase III subunit alpha